MAATAGRMRSSIAWLCAEQIGTTNTPSSLRIESSATYGTALGVKIDPLRRPARAAVLVAYGRYSLSPLG
jgi:hypothetical protein